MTDRDAHLAGIISDPACDTQRLAFADWLEEHGEELRAAFIRDNIAKGDWYTNTSGEPSVVAIALGFTCRNNATGKIGPVYAHITFAPAIPGVAWSVRRGFAEGVTLSAEDWARLGDELVSKYPIQAVTLTTVPVIADREKFVQKTLAHICILQQPVHILRALWPSIPLAGWRLPESDARQNRGVSDFFAAVNPLEVVRRNRRS